MDRHRLDLKKLWQSMLGQDDKYWNELDSVLWKSSLSEEEQRRQITDIVSRREGHIRDFLSSLWQLADPAERQEHVSDLSKRERMLRDFIRLKTPHVPQSKSVEALALRACPHAGGQAMSPVRVSTGGTSPLGLLMVETPATPARVGRLRRAIAGDTEKQ